MNNLTILALKSTMPPNFKGEASKKTKKADDEKFLRKTELRLYKALNINEPSPIAKGAFSAVANFGILYGLDKVVNKLLPINKTPLNATLKSSNKFSLLINAATGLLCGVISYSRAKKNQDKKALALGNVNSQNQTQDKIKAE